MSALPERRSQTAAAARDAAPLAARSIVKRAALSLAGITGALRLSEFFSRHSLVVLTYHRVVPRECCPSGVRPPNSLFCDEFDRQMQFVARRYDVLDGVRLRAVLASETLTPKRALAITFDDGYENNYTFALPILRRYGLQAVFFVTTSFVGGERPFLWFDRLDRLLAQVTVAEVTAVLRQSVADAKLTSLGLRAFFKQLPSARQDDLLSYLEERIEPALNAAGDRAIYAPLAWDQVREMSASGMTIGSHTENHQILAAVDATEASREISVSRARIEEHTGQACWCFGYPNGQRSDFRTSDEDAAERAGYLCAFTQIPGVVSRETPRYRLPRIPVPDNGDLRVFRSHVSGLRRGLRRLVRDAS